MNEDNIKTRLENLIRHIRDVQDNCLLLGNKLIEQGEEVLGLSLIRESFHHDVSKFSGIEWDYLNTYDPKIKKQKSFQKNLALAVHQHTTTNLHHPEYWGSIHNMSDLYIAEMVCDWKARSSEFGGSVMDWIKDHAMERYKFKESDPIYEKIQRFLSLLCPVPF